MDDVKMRKNLNGPEGLITAVIARAANDAVGAHKVQRADAWRYFASDTYTNHLELLGLSAELLPLAIEAMAHE